MVKKIAFVGISHLGIVSSICFLKFGYHVTILDSDKKAARELKNGVMPPEPGLKEIYNKYKKNYNAISDFSQIKKFDIIFFVKDSPTEDSASLDTINKLIAKTTRNLSEKSVLVLMSQIPVGFSRKLNQRIKDKLPKSKMKLYYWVNTIVVGNSLERFLNPERIIVGLEKSSNSLDKNLKLILKNFGCPLLKMSYESAELTKSAVNLFLASSITAANTLSDVCEIVGANINEIISALRSDKRIGAFAYLTPTIRISGGHLERELYRIKNISKKNLGTSGFAGTILRLNSNRYRWVLRKLNSYLFNHIKKPIITIWGLSYKENTTSTHNAASLFLINALHKKAVLKTYDPIAKMPEMEGRYYRLDNKYSALSKSNCLIILTPWPEFKNANVAKISKSLTPKLIIDCSGALKDQRHKLEKGFTYITLGSRPNVPLD